MKQETKRSHLNLSYNHTESLAFIMAKGLGDITKDRRRKFLTRYKQSQALIQNDDYYKWIDFFVRVFLKDDESIVIVSRESWRALRDNSKTEQRLCSPHLLLQFLKLEHIYIFSE